MSNFRSPQAKMSNNALIIHKEEDIKMTNHYVEEDLGTLLKGLDLKLGKIDNKKGNQQDASGFFKFNSFKKVGNNDDKEKRMEKNKDGKDGPPKKNLIIKRQAYVDKHGLVIDPKEEQKKTVQKRKTMSMTE